MVWGQFVDLIHGALLCISTALGGSMGWAIAVLSLLVRVVLLPLTLRLAYRGLETQAALKRLEPELKRVRAKYKGRPGQAAGRDGQAIPEARCETRGRSQPGWHSRSVTDLHRPVRGHPTRPRVWRVVPVGEEHRFA